MPGRQLRKAVGEGQHVGYYTDKLQNYEARAAAWDAQWCQASWTQPLEWWSESWQ